MLAESMDTELHKLSWALAKAEQNVSKEPFNTTFKQRPPPLPRALPSTEPRCSPLPSLSANNRPGTPQGCTGA
jgi:hypothetical protein